MVLRKAFANRHIAEIDGTTEPTVLPERLNVISCRKFTFQGLHEHRDKVRERLIGIISEPIPADHNWGKGRFIAAHIRLGDFTIPQDGTQVRRNSNTRIPLSWYESVIRVLQKRYPDMPVRIFSDGEDSELQPLLALGASTYRSGSDIRDLLTMSSASILVGSNSTYSLWAAFLGNMPTLWLDVERRDDKPSAPETPILFVPLDETEPKLW